MRTLGHQVVGNHPSASAKMSQQNKMQNKKWNKNSGIKIGGHPGTSGDGDHPNLSAKRSQWNKKQNKN